MDTTIVAAMWQGTISAGDGHWLMIFAGITAFALLLQSLVIVFVGIGAKKMQDHLGGQVAEMKAKILPLLAKSEALMTQVSEITTDLTPKIKRISTQVETISAHAEDISAMLKAKVVEFGPTIDAANETIQQANLTVRSANAKTQEQVVRVNGMVTSVLDATAQVGKAIQHGINVPVHEVSRIIDGVKVGLVTFLNGKPKRMPPPVYRPPVGTYKPDSEA